MSLKQATKTGLKFEKGFKWQPVNKRCLLTGWEIRFSTMVLFIHSRVVGSFFGNVDVMGV